MISTEYVEEPVLELRNISVGYFDTLVFQDLNFIVRKSQTWALTGQGGSGKTSLLKLLAGELPIRKGSYIKNFYEEFKTKHPQLINPFFNWKLIVAFVGNRHQFTTLSNTRNFYYQQRFNSTDSEDSLTVKSYLQQVYNPIENEHWELIETIELCKLERLLDKQLILLSNGETRKLLLAHALLKQPSLLLLDNPLSGLDQESRKDFDNILSKIVDRGIHIILSTSSTDIPEAVTHIAEIKNGSIINTFSRKVYHPIHLPAEQSPTNELFQNWLNIYKIPVYDTIIELKNGSVQYGNKRLLHGINWTVKQGERWAITGQNGAGKSTLISLITGDNPQAYANHLTLFDKKRGTGESIWQIKQQIGYVSPELFQYFPLETTVFNAVTSGFFDTIGLFCKPSLQHIQKVKELLIAIGINDYANQQLRQLPASIQRLALLARALIKKPALLILDEPCQGLDENQIFNLKNLIDEICLQTSITLLYVSHYSSDIPEAVNKKIALKDGYAVTSSEE